MEFGAEFVDATVSADYVHDDFARSPGDDGKFCVVKFTFVPPVPDLQGYTIAFPKGPGQGYGLTVTLDSGRTDPPGGRGYGTFHFVMQSCTDYDAPPERPC